MLTPTGFVTDAYLLVNMRNHWTSYYKWLQRGKWSWLALARQFLRLVLANVKQDVLYLTIDDTLILRSSKKAPCSQIHHQHGNKANLATYVLGQCWVNLAMIVRRANNESVAFHTFAIDAQQWQYRQTGCSHDVDTRHLWIVSGNEGSCFNRQLVHAALFYCLMIGQRPMLV